MQEPDKPRLALFSVRHITLYDSRSLRLLVSSRFGFCARQRDSAPESFMSSGLVLIQPKCHIDFHNIALVMCGPAVRARAENGPWMPFPAFMPGKLTPLSPTPSHKIPA